MHKAPLAQFLAQNPFPNPLTDGLFYREKMRAIHQVAPQTLCEAGRAPRVLDVGGGRSGLARLLYPRAEVITVDLDASLHGQGPGQGAAFACADATRLPFADEAFDAVSLFDILEHVPEDGRAAAEALRVVRRDGHVLVSTPNDHWRYPHYRFMGQFCPHESELMSEWGHVRRGYDSGTLNTLFGGPPMRSASFTNGVTAFYHDLAFSRLGRRKRKVLYALSAPAVALGYLCHAPSKTGAEIALAWRR